VARARAGVRANTTSARRRLTACLLRDEDSARRETRAGAAATDAQAAHGQVGKPLQERAGTVAALVGLRRWRRRASLRAFLSTSGLWTRASHEFASSTRAPGYTRQLVVRTRPALFARDLYYHGIAKEEVVYVAVAVLFSFHSALQWTRVAPYTWLTKVTSASFCK
jgi:hypothetical protein